MSDIIRTKIAGVSHDNPDGESRQKIIKKYVSKGLSLQLVREPDNPYGENAIAVFINSPVEKFHKQLGYIHSELSTRLAKIMDSGKFVSAKVLNVTGKDKDTLGVNIEIHIIDQVTTPPIITQPKEKKPLPAMMVVILAVTGLFLIFAAVIAIIGNSM